MTYLLPVALALIILSALLVFLSTKQTSGIRAGTYYLRRSLLSPAERSFLGVLESNLPRDVRVFSKVRIEDIVGVKTGLDRGARTAARNRINRKHVDFLLVRASDLAPLAAMELDDRSHDAEVRQTRDRLVDDIFRDAGLPLLHIPAQKSYNPAEIQTKLSAVLLRP